jgi:hypothetical protein
MIMRRFMVALACLLVCTPARSQVTLLTGAGKGTTAALYQGPGDIVSWYAWGSCAFAYSASYAAGANKACNILRASDSTTQDIDFLITGPLNVASYNSFVGTDATASCTLASTTAACSGASATIHVNDPVTGTGITNPCIVTAASQTVPTLANPFTGASCGTIGSAETFSFQGIGYVATVYDETGNGHNWTQGTSGVRPQLLPLCIGGLYPCEYYNGSYGMAATVTAQSQPMTYAGVGERTSNFTSAQSFLDSFASGSQNQLDWAGSANTIQIYAGSTLTATASDSTLHSLIGVVSSSVCVINVDGVETPSSANGNCGTGVNNTTLGRGQQDSGGAAKLHGLIGEAGFYSGGMTSGQRKSECENAQLRYGASNFGAAC